MITKMSLMMAAILAMILVPHQHHFSYYVGAVVAVSAQSTNKRCRRNSLVVPSSVTHRTSKLVIAHRGASYHFPEHTLVAYRTALSMGADYIEPDIIASGDGVLYAMHSVDLNLTTNVAEKFPHRRWFSPTVQREGYWSFNFSSTELDQLTVRQRLPEGRSTAYDGLWPIPRLERVLGELREWNMIHLQKILPLVVNGGMAQGASRWRPTALQLRQAGIYIELKDANWLKDEAGLDLVGLLYQHFTQYWDLWEHLMPCFTVERFDEYKLPGLVLQSFDVEALVNFHLEWSQYFRDELTTQEQDETASSSTTSPTPPGPDHDEKTLAPEPPYVLLVDDHICSGLEMEEFWVKVGNSWAAFLSGIGCDKNCLWGHAGQQFATKAKEFNLVLHPWTERPETNFVAETFPSVLDEIRYLFCNVPAVHGIFSESVTAALVAAHEGCSSTTNSPTSAPNNKNVKDNNNADDNGDDSDDPLSTICYQSESQAAFYSSLASFVMGVFVTTFIGVWLNRKRRRRYGDGRVVPTVDENELELT